MAKKELRLPAAHGYPMDLTSASDKVNDLAFATAIGLVDWGSENEVKQKRGNLFSSFRSEKKGGGSGTVKQVREWIRSLLP